MMAPVQSTQESTEQYQQYLDAYETWCKNDQVMPFTLLSSMHNDLIYEFEGYRTAREMWDALRLRFGGTTTTRVHGLTMKFDSCKMPA